MRQNRIQRVLIHPVPSPDSRPASERVNEFHAAYIERWLQHAALSPAQKLAVLEQVIATLSKR